MRNYNINTRYNVMKSLKMAIGSESVKMKSFLTLNNKENDFNQHRNSSINKSGWSLHYNFTESLGITYSFFFNCVFDINYSKICNLFNYIRNVL